jgi:hypothetical protein
MPTVTPNLYGLYPQPSVGPVGRICAESDVVVQASLQFWAEHLPVLCIRSSIADSLIKDYAEIILKKRFTSTAYIATTGNPWQV